MRFTATPTGWGMVIDKPGIVDAMTGVIRASDAKVTAKRWLAMSRGGIEIRPLWIRDQRP